MNEMTMLAELGVHLDEEGPSTLPRQRQRQRLIEAAHGRSRRARRIPRPRLVLTAGLLVGAAAAGLIVASTVPVQPHHRPSTVRLDSATVTLERAARTVSAQPYTTPRPTQWIYMKVAEYGVQAPGGRPTYQEYWLRFDGWQEAVIEDGKLVVDQKKAGGSGDEGTPEGASALVRSLPTDPAALLSALSKTVGAEPRGDAAPGRDGLLFANIVQLIRDAPAGVPPKTLAALYRAIARLHGVQVNTTFTDGLGRHVIGLTQGDTNHVVLIDPATYQIVGMQSMWSGRPTPNEIRLAKIKKLNINLPKGAITYGLATIATAIVDHAGQR